jgi:hypothetical protein
LSRCLAIVIIVLFRGNVGELAPSLVVFCLLAGGESIGDELNPARFRFFGVKVRDGVGVEVGVEVCDGVRDNPPGF